MAKLNMAYLSSFKNQQISCVILIAGVTILATPCPRHITVPFGAEVPSGHVAQAWAIPPPSQGLLSQWHRQQTTMPEHPSPESSDIYTLYDDKRRFYMKKYLNYNPFNSIPEYTHHDTHDVICSKF